MEKLPDYLNEMARGEASMLVSEKINELIDGFNDLKIKVYALNDELDENR